MKPNPQIEQWINNNAGEEDVDPRLIQANPANIKIHTDEQIEVWREYVKITGFLGRVLINRPSGLLLDGHLRVSEAIINHEKTVPVQFINLNPEQEKVARVYYDQIGGLAVLDMPKLAYASQDLTALGKASRAFLEALPGLRTVGEQYSSNLKLGLENTGDYGGLFDDSAKLGSLEINDAPSSGGPIKIVLRQDEAEEFLNFLEGINKDEDVRGNSTVLIIMSNH